MEIKAGYKQTEVGVIPEDWEIARIIDCCSYADYRGKTPPKSSSGTVLVTARNVRKGFIDYEGSQEYVPTDLYDQIMRRGRPRAGDILITTEAPLGNVAQVDREDIALAQRIIKYRPLDGLSANYLKQYLLSERFQQILFDHSSGSTAKGIKGSVLHQLPVVIPPPKEHQAIADALSDVDALLAGLDRLIAKKRDLKQAAMQQLLTGQTRLPGFGRKLGFTNTEIGLIPEDWIVAEVREVVRSHRQGYYTTTPYSNDGVRLVRITDLMNPRLDYTTMPMLRITQNDRDLYSIRRGDFLFARSGAIGRYGIVYHDIDAIFGSYIIRFTFDSTRLVNEFFGYLYQMRTVWRQLLAITQGSSNININASNIKSIKIPLPSANEQTAIAEVLTDMDEEIAGLAQRRQKTRALKQAMMRELLTGKTRLI